jgi:hypothetical protein
VIWINSQLTDRRLADVDGSDSRPHRNHANRCYIRLIKRVELSPYAGEAVGLIQIFGVGQDEAILGPAPKSFNELEEQWRPEIQRPLMICHFKPRS